MVTPLVGAPIVYVEETGEPRAAFITKVHKGQKAEDVVDLAFFRPVSERSSVRDFEKRGFDPQRPAPRDGQVVGDFPFAVMKVPRCNGFAKEPGHWFWR